MKRKLEPAKEDGASLMTLHRVEGTTRLMLVITDFGHDYRNSFYETEDEHRAAVLAHVAEDAFANELARERSRFGRAFDPARLSRDPATQELLLEN
jgi:hypothetical protein